MNEKSFVILSISTFEKTASEVIQLMAEHFDLDLSDDNPFHKLLSRQNNLWKGQFGEWNYQFHGDACTFENVDSKQLLDVKINRGKHFGAISEYYLVRFIKTTPALTQLDVNIDEKRIYAIIRELKENGTIVNIGDEIASTWILNTSILE